MRGDWPPPPASRTLLSYALITVTLAVVVIGGTRVLFARATQEYSKDKVLASMYLLQQPVEATVARVVSPPTEVVPGRSPLDDITARKVLRVCYLPAAMPFAFFNERGDLVGFDIELAHRLARELGVTLAFVPADRTKLAGLLADGYCDLAMSGVVVTTLRAGEMLFSESYLDETLGLMVADHRRDEFASWDAIRDLGAITILAPDLPDDIDKLRELAPRAVIKIQSLDEPMLPDHRPEGGRRVAAGRARVGVDADVPAVFRGGAGSHSDPRAARISHRQT